MLRIRFFRGGKKKQPFFRIVVVEKKAAPKGGNVIEVLGFYNPLTKERRLKKERILYWLSVGAKPSHTVYNLLITESLIKGKKIAVHVRAADKPDKIDRAGQIDETAQANQAN